MRAAGAACLAVIVGMIGACGGSTPESAAPGNSLRPLVAQPTDPSTSSDLARLNEAESPRADTATDPPICDLVPEGKAKAILGSLSGRPVVATQGPACVYQARTRRGEDPRDGFVSVSVQHRALDDARAQLHRTRRIDVSGRPGYCGESGQPMLFVAIDADRVLGVVGSCDVAKRFATQALKQI